MEGLPESFVGTKNIEVVRILILQDLHVAYRETEATMTSIDKILHKNISVKRVLAHLISHNFVQPLFKRDLY